MERGDGRAARATLGADRRTPGHAVDLGARARQAPRSRHLTGWQVACPTKSSLLCGRDSRRPAAASPHFGVDRRSCRRQCSAWLACSTRTRSQCPLSCGTTVHLRGRRSEACAHSACAPAKARHEQDLPERDLLGEQLLASLASEARQDGGRGRPRARRGRAHSALPPAPTPAQAACAVRSGAVSAAGLRQSRPVRSGGALLGMDEPQLHLLAASAPMPAAGGPPPADPGAGGGLRAPWPAASAGASVSRISTRADMEPWLPAQDRELPTLPALGAGLVDGQPCCLPRAAAAGAQCDRAGAAVGGQAALQPTPRRDPGAARRRGGITPRNSAHG